VESKLKIRTDYWADRLGASDKWDWSATSDNYEPGDPVGYGRTELEAIADFEEKIEAKDGC
jgi:hypothetical protein